MNNQTRKFYLNRKLSLLAIILSAFLSASSTQVFAVDFMVNLTTDQHDANLEDGICDIDLAAAGEQCSLRAATEQHKSLFISNHRILFDLPAKSTITLTTVNGGEIVIRLVASTLEIIGTGADNLTIDGGAGDNRIFYIDSTSATISGLTLTGGNVGNNGGGGGAVYAGQVSLTLDRVHVTGNSASGGSGGVFFGSNIQSRHRIINSTFSNNSTSAGCGGFSNGEGSDLIIVNSTISGNTASESGGGFCNRGNAVLRNVTITNNNSGTGGGGGIYNNAASFNNIARLNFGNTIIAGNTATSTSYGPEILSLGSIITSAGGNLVGDSLGDSTNTTLPSIPNAPLISYQPTDIRDKNPMLGTLSNNGGPTPTHALLAGSPLIDAGLNDVAVDPATFDPVLRFDQRGRPFARVRDGNGDGSAIVDIGAFERFSASAARPTEFDFDGDGRADIAVFRPSNGVWYIQKSTGGFSFIQWGQTDDRLVPGDYDGDGRTDAAVFRASESGTWYILKSSDNQSFIRRWGIDQGYGGVTPLPGDYDGDGKTDLIVQINDDFVGAIPYYKILQSSTDSRVDKRFGGAFKVLAPKDYDGDGKDDLAQISVFANNPAVINWVIPQSSNNLVKVVQFGLSTDRVVPADYDGDGRTDIAVYRPSNGFWYRFNSSDGSFYAEQFGAAEDKPVPADYDGDGRTDIAVFRPSNGTWYLQKSREGFAAHVFGFSDDIPIPNVYVR